MNTFLRVVLFPFSCIYGFIIYCRNRCYDIKIFKSEEFHLPVISVGNITVGGTGKTPHSEYLITLLKDSYKIAFLSRGYKRKTKGFVLANEQSTAKSIGDEPLQIKRKFPELIVAVDKKRVNGIHMLMKHIPDLDIVLLDDAYQHRAVTPGINILLIDYYRPIKTDWIMPLGRLRESPAEKKRADIIIVSKAPKNINAMERHFIEHQIKAKPHQTIYFTTIAYGMPLPVFPEREKEFLPDKNLSVLLITGIAEPKLLLEELKANYLKVEHLSYPDHYEYTQKDIDHIQHTFQAIPDEQKMILTTEKDAARLISFSEVMGDTVEYWFYVPIEMKFLGNEAEHFNHQIIHYVKNNSRNSILYKK